MKKKKTLTIIISILVLFFAVFIACSVGAANITAKDALKVIVSKIFNVDILGNIKPSTETIIWNVRFPRILLALLIGGVLSVAGTTYQGLLKNPMADPYIIGVSSGAAFGAAVAIASKITFEFLGLSFISIMAFSVAVLVMIIVYTISRVGRKVPVTTLLLSGIAIGNFLTAFTSLIMIFSKDDLNKIYFWTMGSLSGKGWEQLIAILPYVVIGIVIIYYFAGDLNIILLGEDTASNLGVEVEKVKRILLLVSTIITAAVVSVSGIIGFVGLIVPHISRLIIGSDNKQLIPLSFVFGAILMICCDTIARSIMVQEIPVGLITAILGGPFFIFLLKRKKKDVN